MASRRVSKLTRSALAAIDAPKLSLSRSYFSSTLRNSVIPLSVPKVFGSRLVDGADVALAKYLPATFTRNFHFTPAAASNHECIPWIIGETSDTPLILDNARRTHKAEMGADFELVDHLFGNQRVTVQNPEGKYLTDLTELARRGKLDSIIGKDDEIRKCIEILSRRTNPLIIGYGDSGVGKTAIVEGLLSSNSCKLAQRIVSGDVPEPLLNTKLIFLGMGSWFAGAKYSEDFKERLNEELDEVAASNNGKVILFIDEIHTVLAADRFELRCIGAITHEEYQKYFVKDPALEQGFEEVFCRQCFAEDTISILRGLRERYELHHGVKISDNALLSAAILAKQCITERSEVLAGRYLTERFFPNKAAAKLKMEIAYKLTELDEIDRAAWKLEREKFFLEVDTDEASKEFLRKLEQDLSRLKQKQKELTELWDREKSLMTRIRSIKEEIVRVDLEIEMEAAEREFDLNRVAGLKYGILISLYHQLEEARKNFHDFRNSGTSLHREEVTNLDIAEMVRKWTSIL